MSVPERMLSAFSSYARGWVEGWLRADLDERTYFEYEYRSGWIDGLKTARGAELVRREFVLTSYLGDGAKDALRAAPCPACFVRPGTPCVETADGIHSLRLLAYYVLHEDKHGIDHTQDGAPKGTGRPKQPEVARPRLSENSGHDQLSTSGGVGHSSPAVAASPVRSRNRDPAKLNGAAVRDRSGERVRGGKAGPDRGGGA